MAGFSVIEPLKIIVYQPGPDYDQRLPAGYWTGTRQVTSTGAGADDFCSFAPTSALDAAKYLWSLEQFTVRLNNAHANDGEFVVVTAEPDTDTAGNVNNRVLTWPAARAVLTIAGTPTVWYPQMESRRWMNYIHQPGGGLTNSYGFRVTGVAAGNIYTFNAWGYIWLPQARRLGGGPARPN